MKLVKRAFWILLFLLLIIIFNDDVSFGATYKPKVSNGHVCFNEKELCSYDAEELIGKTFEDKIKETANHWKCMHSYSTDPKEDDLKIDCIIDVCNDSATVYYKTNSSKKEVEGRDLVDFKTLASLCITNDESHLVEWFHGKSDVFDGKYGIPYSKLAPPRKRGDWYIANITRVDKLDTDVRILVCSFGEGNVGQERLYYDNGTIQKSGNLTIKKVDADTNEALSGIGFKVQGSNDKYLTADKERI